MVKTISAITVLLVLASGCLMAKRYDTTNIPEITILTPSGWILHIDRDGSGYVGFGQAAKDFAHFTTGTFDFNEVCGNLIASTVFKGSPLAHYSVVFEQSGQARAGAKYTSDTEQIKRLFTRAVARADRRGTRILEMFRARPPTPKK